MRQAGTFMKALYALYEQSQFSMAGAVAFSFVVSIFPFCIFMGALSGLFGDRELADHAIEQLMQILPPAVVEGLAPDIQATMGHTRIDLLTLSGAFALFFATSAIETMRAALNGAYRARETRPYVLCLSVSMLFVFISALAMLVVAWGVVVGPAIAQKFGAATWLPGARSWLHTLLNSTWLAALARYAIAGGMIAASLVALHLWLAAGRRTLWQVLPGVLLSVLLWLTMAGFYSFYLNFSDYTRFYAGLSQLMVALIFFQFTAIIIILGAELNRGIIELKKLASDGKLEPVSGRGLEAA
jgi:membrane protein